MGLLVIALLSLIFDTPETAINAHNAGHSHKTLFNAWTRPQQVKVVNSLSPTSPIPKKSFTRQISKVGCSSTKTWYMYAQLTIFSQSSSRSAWLDNVFMYRFQYKQRLKKKDGGGDTSDSEEELSEDDEFDKRWAAIINLFDRLRVAKCYPLVSILKLSCQSQEAVLLHKNRPN